MGGGPAGCGGAFGVQVASIPQIKAAILARHGSEAGYYEGKTWGQQVYDDSIWANRGGALVPSIQR